ncbi:unnamed protein product [Clonostachys byssicola]|uniref:Uncharacterized protein n=1 Tax=Clonostachys byssicola TaxID=160290 RepID=A0A9N9UG60_9HYPO|nr:unnamed protein product [Clonostachys byssicola]
MLSYLKHSYMRTDLVLDFLKSTNYVPETRKLEHADEMAAVKGKASGIHPLLGFASHNVDD